MKKKFLPWAVFFLLALLWGYSLFFVPTFDLDESLYRRVAEEIKVYQNPWRPTWDSWALFHKPPVFYWIILFFSRLFQDAQTEVGVLAARMPSLLASVGILITLYFSRDFIFGRSNEKNSKQERWFAPLLYLSALFPLLTGTAVIFDPLQTFLLMPSLLIPTRYFVNEEWRKNKRLPLTQLTLWALSLFTATAVKGLNAITIPAFAFGVQLLLVWWNHRHSPGAFRLVWREGCRFLFFVFIPAIFMCFLWFYYLDQKMGPEFTHEFFWVQHLNRSEEVMEMHGGSIFYHPLVFIFAGGFLSSFFLFQVFEFWNRRNEMVRDSFLQYGFPATFIFSFIFAFSFSATKLPHYTWPIWPALALLCMIQLHRTPHFFGSTLSRAQRYVAVLPVGLLALLFLFCAFNAQKLLLSDSTPLTQSARTILSQFQGFPLLSQIFLLIGLAICVFFFRSRLRWIQRPIFLCLASLSTALLLSLSVMPVAIDLMVTPPDRIGNALKTKYLKGKECIRYAGPHSPTLSLAIGFSAFHNRCEPEDAVYLIVPAWKEHECHDRKFVMLEKEGYLYLCGKTAAPQK